MNRHKKVLEKAEYIISQGRKPSAAVISEELGWPENDVHRCLNSLEKKNKVETYSKAFNGRKHRLIGVKR